MFKILNTLEVRLIASIVVITTLAAIGLLSGLLVLIPNSFTRFYESVTTREITLNEIQDVGEQIVNRFIEVNRDIREIPVIIDRLAEEYQIIKEYQIAVKGRDGQVIVSFSSNPNDTITVHADDGPPEDIELGELTDDLLLDDVGTREEIQGSGNSTGGSFANDSVTSMDSEFNNMRFVSWEIPLIEFNLDTINPDERTSVRFIQPGRRTLEVTADPDEEESILPSLFEFGSILRRTIEVTLIFSITAFVLVLVAVVVFITRRSFRPMVPLLAAARAIGRGDFSHRVKEKGIDEFKRLSQSFNYMAASLGKAEEVQKRMTSDTAHELRTPIHNIKGYIEAIRNGVVEPNEEIVGILHDQASHLAKIVEDLQILAVADAGTLKFEFTSNDIADMVKGVIKEFAQLAQSQKIEIRYVGPDEFNFEFDRLRIRQVIVNLLSNAITHSRAGSYIQAKLESDDAGGVIIKVIDHGSGISAENLENVFDRFYRTDSSRVRTTGGSGLGLTICKKIVVAHGGEISAESELNEGSTFSVRLPPRESNAGQN